MGWTRGPTIGRGSTATVSLAASLSSGELFAVKSADLSNSMFLQREQEFLSKISSSFIVKYLGYEITRENNVPVYNLCLEYVSGGTLRDGIHRQGGHLDEPKIRSYTRDILQGLDYLHRSIGSAHCDIKSQNVLVTKEGAKIADFGCARLVRGVKTKSEFAGTPAFMAPEVARGEDQGYAADIWALGCTVIEMATGRHPWEEEFSDPVSALYRIAFSGDVPEFPGWLSEKGKDFLSKCLRREAKERWTAKELLDHPFVNEVELVAKEVDQGLTMSSPSCVLDEGFWDTMEARESPQDLGYLDSAAERIKRLIGGSLSLVLDVPNWGLEEEDWITVRSNDAEEINKREEENSLIPEDDASVSTRFLVPDSFINEQEEEIFLLLEDLLLEFCVEDASSSGSSSRNREVGTIGLDNFVSENFNLETDNENSRFLQSLEFFPFSGWINVLKNSDPFKIATVVQLVWNLLIYQILIKKTPISYHI